MNILVLVAHPDDETILCGATIDKLINKGHQVHVCFYTKNEEAYFGKETQKSRILRLNNEVKAVSSVLGYSFSFLGFKDSQLASKKPELIEATIKQIRHYKPDLIITEHFSDKHSDHRTLAEIVPEANFQSGNKLFGGNIVWSADAILMGEVNLEMTALFDFNIVSKLSPDNLKQKIKCLNIYESIKDEHSTTSKWLEEKVSYSAKMRGKAAKTDLGEAFHIDNYVPLNSVGLKKIEEVI